MEQSSTHDRTGWFAQVRFGMFVHWGLYSVLGHGEWAFNRERWDMKEYARLAGKFTARKFDPKIWARLAVDTGMKYMVLTTKHHEGFCLWDSQTCRFNATRSAARRDLLAEYVGAVRDAGLKVGLYYSLGDWYNPDWAKGWQGDTPARFKFGSLALATGHAVNDVKQFSVGGKDHYVMALHKKGDVTGAADTDKLWYSLSSDGRTFGKEIRISG